ncbi:hypothetical protein GGI25_003583 [Coemansia spiralis]|uniref:Uncharacterized protein n=2 Tax=Coemansia TaxID=4863 RepID=A0A9W8KWD9_9FUNG|nr:hypothetical protein EDC05_003617 [Coemansia umbellata]KAJ2621284.1 hypothetical protein GGI26_004258 [Coemansia sp. RSA 1358]KAJ2676433.1 hypothetical protein GGI25_003583 [Coemansia spiralis]
MAAATVATASTPQGTKEPATPCQISTKSAASRTMPREKCPKCSNKIECYAVDTNCSFKMCANVDCTWPFDCENMSQCFEHDATVPSMRRRAKKRKALASKEEQRRVKRLSMVKKDSPGFASMSDAAAIKNNNSSTMQISDSQLSSVLPSAIHTMPSVDSSFATDIGVTALPFLTTEDSGDNSVSQLDDWLAKLCNNTSSAAIASSTAAFADSSGVVGTSSRHTTSSNMLLTQGKYEQIAQNISAADCKNNTEASSGTGVADTLSYPGPCNKPSYNDPLSPYWLESLLLPSSKMNEAFSSVGAANAADRPLVSFEAPATFSFPPLLSQQFSIDGVFGLSTSSPSAAPVSRGSLFDSYKDNVVADIFSVLGSSSSSASALTSTTDALLHPVLSPSSSETVTPTTATVGSVSVPAAGTTAKSPSTAFSDDAVIPRTSRHSSPATSNSESGADDIDANTPFSPDDLAMLIGGGANTKNVPKLLLQPTSSQQSTSAASATVLDPLSALLSPPESASFGMQSVLSKQDEASASGSLGLLDQYYWSSSAPITASTATGTNIKGGSSVLSPVVPASRSASCSDVVPFDISHLFSTQSADTSATVAYSPPSALPAASLASVAPTTMASTPVDDLPAVLDTASIIDKILGKSCTSSAS